MYWFAIYCEMMTTIKLINTSIVSSSFCFFVVRTLKIYSNSRFQEYKSTIINYSHHAIQQIPPDLFNLVFDPLANSPHFPHNPASGNHHSTLYESAFFRIHISVMNFFAKVWILIFVLRWLLLWLAVVSNPQFHSLQAQHPQHNPKGYLTT